jgi:sporulation protein YlmC with PRC-barrel domain
MSITRPLTPPSRGARIVGTGRRDPRGPGADLMAAATLEGDKVLSDDGHDIGKVKDIMLDVRAGRVAYVVMSTGGFLGIGDRLLAIPWDALTLDLDRRCLHLDMSAERVKHAPGFDKGHWPSMADQTWRSSVHQYFGREPHWYPGMTVLVDDPEPGAPTAPEAGSVKT